MAAWWSTIWLYVAAGYMAAVYLANAYVNNCFAITHEALLVVNPNFPFRRVTAVPFRHITTIEIDREKRIYGAPLLMVMSGHYVKVHTAAGAKRYFCAALEPDSFDGPPAEYSLDCLHADLKASGIPVVFRADG